MAQFARTTMTVDVLDTFLGATSPVKLVQFMTDSGSTQEAVLKLYDRRYGGHIRQFYGTATVPSRASEDAYHLFGLSIMPDGMARFEAVTWYEYDQRLKTEFRAYKQLEPMQGNEIPRLYAHVRIPLSVVDPDVEGVGTESEEFLCVHGLLLQYIPGLRLSHLPTPGLAQIIDKPVHDALAELVQRAVDAMYEINKFGILLKTNSNDVILQQRNNVAVDSPERPYIIDFAEAVFKEDLVEIWIKQRETNDLVATEDPPWHMDIEYWVEAKRNSNPEALAQDFNMYLLRVGISEVQCKTPDYQEIIAQLRLRFQNGELQSIQTQGD
uniref:Protein kinase domain-containing protein n=1 Tax=Fusarium oxysporum (strain Fo5176) TaxID=660025 RepID=A0A0D2XYN7_FUSOF